MRRTLSLTVIFLIATLSMGRADDVVRDVQTQLKTQGFYFGEIDGQAGKDFSAAIRRYQIRNGLEVTGELNDQVTQSLGIGSGASAAPIPGMNPNGTQVAPPAAGSRPPVNIRREEGAPESDRRPIAPEGARPPTGPNGGSTQPSEIYRNIFAGTPYAIAPKPVQEETMLRAQRFLVGRGIMDREQMDGLPGRVTQEAVSAYQEQMRLPVTGRLDLETLSTMRLLPGRAAGGPGEVSRGPAVERAEPPASRAPGAVPRVAKPLTYKGIWVQ